jgi:hypothetical protein
MLYIIYYQVQTLLNNKFINTTYTKLLTLYFFHIENLFLIFHVYIGSFYMRLYFILIHFSLQGRFYI